MDEYSFILNQINELIIERRDKIFKKFLYFEKRGKNKISDIEKIIS